MRSEAFYGQIKSKEHGVDAVLKVDEIPTFENNIQRDHRDVEGWQGREIVFFRHDKQNNLPL